MLIPELCLVGCQRQRPQAQQPVPPSVTVIQPVSYPVQTYYEYNGNLEAVEVVQVTARVKGFLNEILFTEGKEVKEGDLLFKIDPREYTAAVKRADADRLKAITELKRSQTEENRVKKLRGSGAVSDEDYEQRVAARETAEAVLMQTEAALETGKLQLAYTEIRAPITGQISRTLVTKGNLVGQNENTVLTTIVSMDPLYVYYDAPEKDLVEYQKSLQSGQQGEVTSRTLAIEIGVATESGYPHRGVIDFRENRVDSGTGTVRIRGRIPNPRITPGDARILYPGLFAWVRVPNGPPRKLLSIPEDALMTGQEGRFVYVLDEKNVVQKRTVAVGPIVWKTSSGQSNETAWTMSEGSAPESPVKASASASKPSVVPSVIAIESGIKPEDKIVINGLTKIRPGSPVLPDVRELRAPATEKK